MEYDERTGNAPGRLNHWGYMTTNFFAPEARYAAVPGAQVAELKQLIQALHARGIAVFMDVVYNHSGEQGPWRDGDRLAAKCYNLMCQALPQVYRANRRTGSTSPTPPAPATISTSPAGHASPSGWSPIPWRSGTRPTVSTAFASISPESWPTDPTTPPTGSTTIRASPRRICMPSPGIWAGQWYDFMDSHGWSAANNRWAKWLGAYRDEMRLFSQSALAARSTSSA